MGLYTMDPRSSQSIMDQQQCRPRSSMEWACAAAPWRRSSSWGVLEREREGLLVLTKGETCQRDEGDGLAAAAGDS
jgi:hypothetical protein